jgi:hypothetical protein
VLCTRPFEVTARNIARGMGLPQYPFAILDHPLGSLTPDQIRGRAEDAYTQALSILLDDEPLLDP